MVLLSGYTTARNCLKADYPINEVIDSLTEFCDEVVVVDTSDLTEGTWQLLEEKSSKNPKLKIRHFNDIDWSYKYHGVYDGMMKARARALCSGDILFQSDMDEILHPNGYSALRKMVENFPNGQVLAALPVVDYWGSEGKVRIDVPAWKWRLSRNLPYITHGIPKHLRKYDAEKKLFANHGTDGCDYIHSMSGEQIPFVNFVSEEAHALRNQAILNKAFVPAYEKWLNNVVAVMPTIHHFSWYSLNRKVTSYKNFWTGFWGSLYGNPPTGFNPMFGMTRPEDVTPELIQQTAKELNTIGGWVFHQPWDKKTITNHIKINQSYPSIMEEWMKRNHD